MDEEITTENPSTNDFNPFIEPAPDIQEESERVVLDLPAADDSFSGIPSSISFAGESRQEDSDNPSYETKYSRYKQAFLKKFLGNHIQMSGNVNAFSDDNPYFFIDMYGGLGLYRDRSDGELCAGSPILFYTELDEASVPYRGLVYEKNKKRAESLRSSLYHRKDTVKVINDDNRNFLDGLRGSLANTRYETAFYGTYDHSSTQLRYMRGLIYLDFTGCCDVSKIVDVCLNSHLDVLIHHGNTPVKRCEGRGGKWDGKSISGSAISNTHKFQRRHWFTSNHLSAPCNKQQFNFLYGSNNQNASPISEPLSLFDSRFNMVNVFEHDGQLIRLKLTHSNKTLKSVYQIT